MTDGLAAINCMFWLGVLPQISPSPGGPGTYLTQSVIEPHSCTCKIACEFLECFLLSAVFSGVVGKKSRRGGQEVAIFRQTAANFRLRRLWVLKISICPKFPQCGTFSAFLYFFFNFSTCLNFKRAVASLSPCHDATDCLLRCTQQNVEAK